MVVRASEVLALVGEAHSAVHLLVVWQVVYPPFLQFPCPLKGNYNTQSPLCCYVPCTLYNNLKNVCTSMETTGE